MPPRRVDEMSEAELEEYLEWLEMRRREDDGGQAWAGDRGDQ